MYTKLQYFGDQEQTIRNRIHHQGDINAQYLGREKVRTMEFEGRGPYARPDPDHPVDAVILESDPLAYYPLDWGNVGLDYSGNDFHGSVHGTFNRIVRQIGNREMRMTAADPASGIKVYVPGMEKGPMSIEFLYDGTDRQNRVILERGFGSTPNQNISIQTSGTDRKLRANIGGDDVNVGQLVALVEPMHYAITIAADNTAKTYLNGIEVRTATARNQLEQAKDIPFHIFGRQNTVGADYRFVLEGALACVAFYNRVLDPAEIANHHRVIFGGDFRSTK